MKPTLKDAVGGRYYGGLPYRAMTNIIEFIRMLDEVVPGFCQRRDAAVQSGTEIYSNKVRMDQNLNTNIGDSIAWGDSSGWTRGLMMASAMGVLMGRKLMEAEQEV